MRIQRLDCLQNSFPKRKHFRERGKLHVKSKRACSSWTMVCTSSIACQQPFWGTICAICVFPPLELHQMYTLTARFENVLARGSTLVLFLAVHDVMLDERETSTSQWLITQGELDSTNADRLISHRLLDIRWYEAFSRLCTESNKMIKLTSLHTHDERRVSLQAKKCALSSGNVHEETQTIVVATMQTLRILCDELGS